MDEFSENVTLTKWAEEMGAWHFVKIPGIYKDIFDGYANRGLISVTARINNTSWRTSLFPVKKDGSYVIPVKADVRKAENLKDGDKFTIYFKFR